MKDLKKEFERIGKKIYFDWSGDGQSEELWSWIETAITKAKREERERLSRKVDGLKCYVEEDDDAAYNSALNDVLELLTQKEK